MPMINVLLWVSLLLLAGLAYLLVSAYNRAEEQAALQLAGLLRRYPGLAPGNRQSAGCRSAASHIPAPPIPKAPSHGQPLPALRSESIPVRFFEISDRPMTVDSSFVPDYQLPRAAGFDKREEETKEMAAAVDCHYCA